MPFPKSAEELKVAGYTFKNRGTCRGCGASILWYETPAGKKMPLDHGTFEPHWATCPARDQFKKQK